MIIYNYHIENEYLALPFLEAIGRIQSPFQKIDIVESWNDNIWNYILIDDVVMMTERDEFSYYEMIIHLAINILLNNVIGNLNVLVIGGGVGWTLTQLTKYPSHIISNIDIVEIDEAVVSLSKKHFPYC